MIVYDQDKLSRICQAYSLSLVVLHGSYAKGKQTPHSDIDVGIIGDPQIIREKYFDIVGDLSALFGDKFDPVFLNGAEAMITYHVAVDGKPLYEKSKGLFYAFKVSAIARYMDTRKFRLLEKSYIKSVIAKGA